MRDAYQDYAEFLEIAIQVSTYDRFAVNQFRHSAKGHYLMRDEWERLRARNRAFEQGRLDELDGDMSNLTLEEDEE
jgi:hypothetical protein